MTKRGNVKFNGICSKEATDHSVSDDKTSDFYPSDFKKLWYNIFVYSSLNLNKEASTDHFYHCNHIGNNIIDGTPFKT
jgi:hypothetical protein